MPVQSKSSIRTQVGLVLEWFPVVSLLTALADAQRGVPRALAFLQLMQFVAAKTPIKQDDELLKLIEEIVLTPQGRALIDYLSDQIAELMEQANAANRPR